MPVKPGFLLVLVAATMFFALSSPQRAFAGNCDPGNAVDKSYQQAQAAAGQAQESALQKFWEGLPKTDVGQSYCGQQLISLFNTAYNDISPLLNANFGLAGGIASAVAAGVGGIIGTDIGSFANAVCTSTMSSITNSASSLVGLARICLPMSTFGYGGFDFGINANGCSGGASIGLPPSVVGLSVSTPYGGGTWYPQ